MTTKSYPVNNPEPYPCALWFSPKYNYYLSIHFQSALQASQLFGFDGHDLSDDVEDVEAVSSLDAKHEKLEE